MDYHDNVHEVNDYENPTYDPAYDYDADRNDDSEAETCDEDVFSFEGDARAPERWTQVRIHGEVLRVSSFGRVKPYGDIFTPSTEGLQYQGTPYRYYKIDGNNYYIHELVWCAFCGPIPDGYEVRHNQDYVRYRPHRTYVNRLECLTLEPITIDRLRLGR